jgi:hypothetical protein
MKIRHIKRVLIVQLIFAVSVMTFGALGASALDVPAGVTEVSIPVSLSTSSAIAGGEIEFSSTTEVKYARFVPASGIENNIEKTVSGKTHIGFFSSDNKFKPSDGKIAVGNIVFGYAGNDPGKITFSEIDIYTKNASGLDTKTLKPNSVVNVNRQSTVGSAVPGTEQQPGGVAGDGSGTIAEVILPADDASLEALQLANANAEAEAAALAEAEAAAEVDAAIGTGSGGGSSNNSISDGQTPLADGGAVNTQSPWFWAFIATAAVLVALILVFFYKQRKTGEKNSVTAK